MTHVDWLLVIAYGLPLACYAAEFWWTMAADAAACIGQGVAWLRGRRRVDFSAFDKEENRL
jgi:hypothetical protein